MYRSSNIFLGLLWLCFLSLLYMVPLDILKTFFEKKVENLELMYDIVYKLTTENDELKARVKALENLAIDGNNFENHPCKFSGNSHANQRVFTHGTNNPENQSDIDIVESSFPEP